MFKEFEKIIGLNRLKLIHLNDSKSEFNSRKDRHAHLGKGEIGLKGIKSIVTHPRLKKLDFILETPNREGLKKDLEILRSIRNHKRLA